jgi:hypothetical protein
MATIETTTLANPVKAVQKPTPLPAPTASKPKATGMIGFASSQEPAEAQVYSTKPQEWKNSTDQTTSGQLSKLIKADSPLMQQARTNALQQMNARGLTNSSMAVGAAHSAVLDKAIPIANADASQASNVAQYNATQKNQSIRDRDTAMTQASGLNATEYNKILSQHLDQNNKLKLAEIEATYKNQMQSSQSAQQLYSQITKNMSDILMSDAMGIDAKRVAINNQIALLNSGMKSLESTSGLDLGTLLTFDSIPKPPPRTPVKKDDDPITPARPRRSND